MNHDYAHCLDFKPDCPENCFRTKLEREIQRRPELYRPGVGISYMHLGDTGECWRKKVPKEMTAEEAIAAIDMTIAEIEWEYPMEYATAFDMAKEALKKQIPKRAIGEHYANMRCPACNHRIPSGMGSSSRRRDNWCNYCGQKILWGDENG